MRFRSSTGLDLTSVASITSQQSSKGFAHAITVTGSNALAASMLGLSTPAVPMPGTIDTTYINVVPHMSHTEPVTQPVSTAGTLHPRAIGYAPHNTDLELATRC